MVDVIRSVTFPFTSVKNFVSFLIFAFLNTLWFFLLPVIIVNGYAVKLIRSAVEGEKDAPAWPGLNLSEWGYILMHGFFYTVAVLIYLIVPFFIAYLGTAGNFSLWLVLLSLLVFLAVIFVLPMALVNYAATESFIEAFNIPEIFRRIFANILQYLLVYAISAALFITALMLSLRMPILAGLILAYPTVFALHAFGQIMAETQ